nr:required for meiotic nuclear division protein 1 homolog [Onthophagus taurus]
MSGIFKHFSIVRTIIFKPNSFLDLKCLTTFTKTKTHFFLQQNFRKAKPMLIHGNNQDKPSSLQLKKRPLKKKHNLVNDEELASKSGNLFNVSAFSTAGEYDLEKLFLGMKQQQLYEPKFVNNTDVVHAKNKVGLESQDLFFFREGTVVMWNLPQKEIENVLNFVNNFQSDSYSESLIQSEAEKMNYRCEQDGKSTLTSSGEILIPSKDNLLEKYTFSNAIALSVKLGCWESSLQRFIDTIEPITDDLKCGRTIKMKRADVLRKHGELFALRHVINLSSDLLDTPDFYWDQDRLEVLYSHVCAYFSITKRTRVMNEKINHCVELIELLSSHLSDNHHVRLEWMVIVLIMIEVGFESLHYVERLLSV